MTTGRIALFALLVADHDAAIALHGNRWDLIQSRPAG
jgi:hypothetical protein